MIITIHQPNFFPWYPLFEKIKQADVFVILGHCQYEKNGHQNRFNYRNAWHTMSINKGLEPIKNKRYINPLSDWNKIKTNIKDKKHILDLFDNCISDNMYDTNVKIITQLMKMLDIKTKIEFDYPTDAKSSERLLDICKNYKATTYLAGSSGANYLDLSIFAANNISVSIQDLSKAKLVHTLDVL